MWAGPLTGGDLVVALVNRGSVDANVTADLSLVLEAGVDHDSAATAAAAAGATTYKVRDLWLRQDAGQATGVLSALVPTHDMKIFRLTPA